MFTDLYFEPNRFKIIITVTNKSLIANFFQFNPLELHVGKSIHNVTICNYGVGIVKLLSLVNGMFECPFCCWVQ